jgi:hypothetical protein
MSILTYVDYSQHLVVIALVFGGVQLDVLHIYPSMLQVKATDGAQITLYRLIHQRSAASSALGRVTCR